MVPPAVALPAVELVRPRAEHLPSYLDALRRGWSPNTEHVGLDQAAIDRVTRDPDRFLALCDDREAAGDPIELPDGTTVPRLPGLTRWMWDGEFAGAINLRWQPGTRELPPTCLGHIGYSVVPWKRRRGYATAALAAMLAIAAAEGLPIVDITTDVDNVASQRVILANGGVLVEQFTKPASSGGGAALRFAVDLSGDLSGISG
jgi:predicted acetyltransferase